jgi:Holliday junction resolvase RusA-like endonuclease
MNWTEDQLREKGYTRSQDGHYYFTPTRVSNPVPKHPAQQALVALPKRKEKVSNRTYVRITRYSTRPLDCDNYAGGCKPIIDQLRYAKLIKDDSPEDIEVQFKQVKIKTKTEEHTKIEISDKLID